MKRIIVALTVLAVMLVTGSAFAAGSSTVGVAAVVTGTCKWVSAAGTVAFGTLDQDTQPAVAGTVTDPTFWCTNGKAYTIVDDDGLNESGVTHRLTDGAGAFLAYSFSYTAAGTGSGKSTTLNPAISAGIAGGTYGDLPEGNYGDTVTLTINP